MRLDRLPIDAAVVGFLITAMIVAFALAFTVVDLGDSESADGGDDTTETASGSPTGGPGELVIVMSDNAFDPEELSVPAGETVTINVENHGASIHNVHIADENGDYADAFCDESAPGACSDPDRVGGGSTATITWEVPDAPGTEIPFRCDYHSTEMKGTITIQ